MILFIIIVVLALSCYRPRRYYGGYYRRPIFFHRPYHHRPMGPRPPMGPMMHRPMPPHRGGPRPPMGGPHRF